MLEHELSLLAASNPEKLLESERVIREAELNMKLNVLVSLRRGEPGYTEKREGRQFNIENGAKEEKEGERHEGARSRVTKGDCEGEEGNEEASVRLTSLWRKN